MWHQVRGIPTSDSVIHSLSPCIDMRFSDDLRTPRLHGSARLRTFEMAVGSNDSNDCAYIQPDTDCMTPQDMFTIKVQTTLSIQLSIRSIIQHCCVQAPLFPNAFSELVRAKTKWSIREPLENHREQAFTHRLGADPRQLSS